MTVNLAKLESFDEFVLSPSYLLLQYVVTRSKKLFFVSKKNVSGKKRSKELLMPRKDAGNR